MRWTRSYEGVAYRPASGGVTCLCCLRVGSTSHPVRCPKTTDEVGELIVSMTPGSGSVRWPKTLLATLQYRCISHAQSVESKAWVLLRAVKPLEFRHLYESDGHAFRRPSLPPCSCPSIMHTFDIELSSDLAVRGLRARGALEGPFSHSK